MTKFNYSHSIFSKTLQIIIGCFSLTFISWTEAAHTNIATEEAPQMLLMREITDVVVEQAKKMDLHCVQLNITAPKEVQNLSIEFETDCKADLKRARKLEVELTELLLKLINTDEKVRPFLQEYPFPSHKACISILFNANHNTHKKAVAKVMQLSNQLYYSTFEDDFPVYQVIKIESYDDACKTVLDN